MATPDLVRTAVHGQELIRDVEYPSDHPNSSDRYLLDIPRLIHCLVVNDSPQYIYD